MGAMSSQITSLTVVYTTVYSDEDQRKHQRSAPLAFVWGIHRWPVNSSQKMVNNAENVSICWRHHEALLYWTFPRVNLTKDTLFSSKQALIVARVVVAFSMHLQW